MYNIKTDKAKLRNAEVMISLGGKFFWASFGILFFILVEENFIVNGVTIKIFIEIVLFILFIFLGCLLKIKGIRIYDEVYTKESK